MNPTRAGRTAEAQPAVAQLLKLPTDIRASYAQEIFPIRSPE